MRLSIIFKMPASFIFLLNYILLIFTRGDSSYAYFLRKNYTLAPFNSGMA